MFLLPTKFITFSPAHRDKNARARYERIADNVLIIDRMHTHTMLYKY